MLSTNCKGCRTYLKIEKGVAVSPDELEYNPRYQKSIAGIEPNTEPGVKPAAADPPPTSALSPLPINSAPNDSPKKQDSPPPSSRTKAARKKKRQRRATTPPAPKEASASEETLLIPKEEPETPEAPTNEPPPSASIPQTEPSQALPKKRRKLKAPPPPPKPEPLVKEPTVAKAEQSAIESTQLPEPPQTTPAKPANEPKADMNSQRFRPPTAEASETPKHGIAPLINREKKRMVKCFECEDEHEILADSTSALCPYCGAYIALKDYDIREQENSRIQTRGNVFVHKKGYITGITIQAHNLIIEGEIQGGAECTGDFIVRKTGKINGAVSSDRVIIERRAEVDFLSTVKAREVIINGHVTGSVSCKKLTLKKRATLDGDLTVASLSVEEGAKHTGNIQMTGLI